MREKIIIKIKERCPLEIKNIAYGLKIAEQAKDIGALEKIEFVYADGTREEIKI